MVREPDIADDRLLSLIVWSVVLGSVIIAGFYLIEG